MTDTPNTDNERPYTFNDIIEDPGLAYRLTRDEVQALLNKHIADSKSELPDLKKLDLSKPAHQRRLTGIALEVSKTKTRIDGAGKVIVDGWKKDCAEIDITRKLIRDALDKLRDDIIIPVKDWKVKDAAQKKAKAEQAAQEAQDRQEALPATTPADAPRNAAHGPENKVFGQSEDAAPSRPMLILSRTADQLLFSDKSTGAMVFRTAAGGLGKRGAEVLFVYCLEAWGARIFNTHDIELRSFDINDIHGSL